MLLQQDQDVYKLPEAGHRRQAVRFLGRLLSPPMADGPRLQRVILDYQCPRRNCPLHEITEDPCKADHIHTYDAAPALMQCTDRWTFVSFAYVRNLPSQSWHLRGQGNIPLDRGEEV